MAFITIIHMKTLYNFLDESTLSLAHQEMEDLKKQNNWSINRNYWGIKSYEGGSPGTVGIVHASTQLAERVMGVLSSHVPKADKISVLHYLWYPLSGINMHNDGNKIFGATIYLTPEWNVNWGGLFVYDDSNEGLQAKIPHYNSTSINVNKTYHMVTTVSPLCPYPRHTLQIFGENYET